MNFRSVAQLSDQVLHWTRRLPHDIELVVGVPRSGLLAANLLGLYLNVPIADVDGFLEGRILGQGRRGQRRLDTGDGNGAEFLSRPRKVLVLDDSLFSGNSMREVRERIGESGGPHDVLYGAVYVYPHRLDEVDVYCEPLTWPRVFEWNVLHHPSLGQFCLDMDGVLCRDPSNEENDDGPKYRTFLETAQPYLIPSAKVGWIVTSRLERYRAETEAWLRAHGVEYGELVMLDGHTAASRRQMGIHSALKADVYRSLDAPLFIESNIKQSVEIANLSGKEVICTDTMQMVHPGATVASRFQTGRQRLTRAERATLAARRVAGRSVRALRALVS